MPVVSHAQNGEDLQIAYYVGAKNGATYIDVGCLWPQEHSNSYFFYERNGHGLCIDPNPTVAPSWAVERPRDVFLNCGIASARAELPYYVHGNPVFNTFSPKLSEERSAEAERRKGSQRAGRLLTEIRPIPVMTLDEAVEQAGAVDRFDGQLDFLSIDAEGFELDVINGFSFGELRPKLVVAEHVRRRSERRPPEDAPLVQAIVAHGYWLVGSTGHDVYLLDERA